jgi:hypothetical protein
VVVPDGGGSFGDVIGGLRVLAVGYVIDAFFVWCMCGVSVLLNFFPAMSLDFLKYLLSGG